MKTVKVEFYNVHDSGDGYHSYPIAKFTNLADAMQCAATSKYYSCSGVKTEVEYDIFESFEEYEDYKAEEPRRKALAKLSAKERKLLGLE